MPFVLFNRAGNAFPVIKVEPLPTPVFVAYLGSETLAFDHVDFHEAVDENQCGRRLPFRPLSPRESRHNPYHTVAVRAQEAHLARRAPMP